MRMVIGEVHICCELLSDFVYSFFEHNAYFELTNGFRVVNCFQILYIRSLNTIDRRTIFSSNSCELLSDFVYSFFEHNASSNTGFWILVVNCFQILYIRSLNTMDRVQIGYLISCELLSDFVYSFFEHNIRRSDIQSGCVVNCFQILYIRSLNTIVVMPFIAVTPL